MRYIVIGLCVALFGLLMSAWALTVCAEGKKRGNIEDKYHNTVGRYSTNNKGDVDFTDKEYNLKYRVRGGKVYDPYYREVGKIKQKGK